MEREAVSGFMLTLLFVSMLTLAFSIKPVESEVAQQTVYINADGSIAPVGAPIETFDNITYSLTGNVTYPTYSRIAVQKSNVIIDGKGYTVQGDLWDISVYLSNVNNVTVRSTNVKNSGYGIFLQNSNHSRITENKITDCDQAISLFSSSNTSINGNDLTDNNYGISMLSSKYNSIRANNLTGNWYAGLGLALSSNNDVNGNNVIASIHYGVLLLNSSNNKIYHNNFINNTAQAVTVSESRGVWNYGYPGGNVWNDDYPSGGNYWSDYGGVDVRSGSGQDLLGSDGIGDTPYIIDVYNKDSYPLMNPWTPVHDVAVVSVEPSAAEFYVGQVVNITVAVRNEGIAVETFNVTAFYDKTSVGTQTVVDLSPKESAMLVFEWNTVVVAPGDYTIKAKSSKLPFEIDAENNIMTGPFIIRIKMLGDVNGDNKVDIKDVAMAALAFGSSIGHLRWNSQADINKDNEVDIRDLVLIAKNFGKTYP